MSHTIEHRLALHVAEGGHPLSPAAWAPVLAAVAAWPADELVTPVVERRIWRAGRCGRLKQTVIAWLRDPLGVLDPRTARDELSELLAPLRTARALPALSARALETLQEPRFRYVAGLAALESWMPEGNGAVVPMFAELVRGLERLPGAVALSIVTAPADRTEETDEDAAPAMGPTAVGMAAVPADARRSRQVAFCARLLCEEPLPATLRARLEALCLARRGGPEDWHTDPGSLDMADRGRLFAGFGLPPHGAAADPATATVMLALPTPSAPSAARVDGRPFGGPLPADGPVLGRIARPSGSRARWRLSWSQRRHHVFLTGASGSGKTTTLIRMILDDIEQGRSVVVVDPHGDMVRELAPAVPADRLTLIDQRVPGTAALDLLDADPARAANHLLSAAAEVWPVEFAGPMWHRTMLLSARALEASEFTGHRFSLADVERYITDVAWRSQVIRGLDDGPLKDQASREHQIWQKQPNNGDSSLVSWAASKLSPLTHGASAPLFNHVPKRPLEAEISEGRVTLVALPLGELGTATTRLVGRMFLTRLTTAIAAQGAVRDSDRHPVSVVLDEAHLVSGEALRGLFAQARKYNCSVTVACQSPSQLEPGLEEVLTNALTHLVGRLSRREAERLIDRVGPAGVYALPTLPRHHLLLVLEESDPLLDPLTLTPVPVPELPEEEVVLPARAQPATDPQHDPELEDEVAEQPTPIEEPETLDFAELLDDLFVTP